MKTKVFYYGKNSGSNGAIGIHRRKLNKAGKPYRFFYYNLFKGNLDGKGHKSNVAAIWRGWLLNLLL